MDYPQKQSETEVPWWEKKPDSESSKEKLIEQIKNMQQAQKNLPRALIFKQFVALIYIIINIVFMYVNINSLYMGYIAIYMIPLIIVLLDYFLVVGRLKKIARGEIIE